MSMLPWHRRGPFVVDGVLPRTLCNNLLQHFKSCVRRPRSYQGRVDESKRKCTFVELPDDLGEPVAKLVMPRVDSLFDIESSSIGRQPQVIYCYGPGAGFAVHHDEVTKIEMKRAKRNNQPVIGGDLTTVLFLNHPNEYNGGTLYFERPPLEVRPPQGTLVAFPATRTFMHGVSPIERGERYTLVVRLRVVNVDEPYSTE